MNGVELLKQIGQGGQGVVFCGTLHGLEVAIKVRRGLAGRGRAGERSSVGGVNRWHLVSSLTRR